MSTKHRIAENREEALTLGLSRFKSDSPCVHGHVGQRYTLTRNCVECTKQRVIDARERDRLRLEAARTSQAAGITS